MDRKNIEELIQLALAAKANAYAPYSGFPVGAVLLSSRGERFTGSNVENSSYGLTICAERVALFKAVSNGIREFRMLVLASDAEVPIPPCGACLQAMKEFSEDLEIVSVGRTGERVRWNLKDLLPRAFRFEKED